jgi:hypothetical protein
MLGCLSAGNLTLASSESLFLKRKEVGTSELFVSDLLLLCVFFAKYPF